MPPPESEPARAALFPIPRTEAGREGLRALIAQPRTALLAVDFDGTLAPIVSQAVCRAAASRRASECCARWLHR